MRQCPWCGGDMEYVITDWGGDPVVHENTLACQERCQHRRCQNCDAEIHRGSKNDPNYYDEAGNATCYVIQHFGYEENVGHQP